MGQSACTKQKTEHNKRREALKAARRLTAINAYVNTQISIRPIQKSKWKIDGSTITNLISGISTTLNTKELADAKIKIDGILQKRSEKTQKPETVNT